jgi:preprotein translocase subunit SecY
MKVRSDRNCTFLLLAALAVVVAIVVYRTGFSVPVPGFDEEALKSLESSRPQATAGK